MSDYTDVPRDEKGDVLRVGTAFWANAHQPQLLEALAMEQPREDDEGVLDYAERLAVEAGMLPISKNLRDRNVLRYADRMPKDGEAAGMVRVLGRRVAMTNPVIPPPVEDRTLPHEHDFEEVWRDPDRVFLACACGARTETTTGRAEETADEDPPVEPGDRIPDHRPIPDSDDEWR